MALTYTKLEPIFPFVRAMFPIFWFSGVVVGIVAAYQIAVQQGHVERYFPYISYGGVYPPESFTFTGTTCWAACGAFVSFLIKFNYDVIQERKKMLFPWLLNCALLCLGFAAVVGLTLLGIYPCCKHILESDPILYKKKANWHWVHQVSSGVAFTCGMVYCVCIVISDTYWMRKYPQSRSRIITLLRWVIALGNMGSFVTFFVAHHFSNLKQPNNSDFNQLKWNKDQSGYIAHFIAATGEWALALFFLMFLMTFSYEAYMMRRKDTSGPPRKQTSKKNSITPMELK